MDMAENRRDEFFKPSRTAFRKQTAELIAKDILVLVLIVPFPLLVYIMVDFAVGKAAAVISVILAYAVILAVDVVVMKRLIAEKKQKELRVSEWTASLSEEELKKALHMLYFDRKYGTLYNRVPPYVCHSSRN